MVTEESVAPATASIDVHCLDHESDEIVYVIHALTNENPSSSSDSSSTSSDSTSESASDSSSPSDNESSSASGSVCASASEEEEGVPCSGSDDSVADKNYVPNSEELSSELEDQQSRNTEMEPKTVRTSLLQKKERREGNAPKCGNAT